MKRLLFAAALLLVGFTPAQPDGKGDWSMVGSCEVDASGWGIDYDKSKKRMTFTLWVEGQCDYDE